MTILSGDKDTFQLATDRVTIRIPHTKAGKTETDEYDRKKIIKTLGLEPKQLIDVKGLQGDTSDNIPGVPGVGEKSALKLIQEYDSIENLYEKIEKGEDDLKGKQKDKIIENKELAILSKTLGTINLNVPIEENLEDLKREEWDKEKVLKIFKELRFNRYIDRFSLRDDEIKENDEPKEEKELYRKSNKTQEEIIELIKRQKEMIFYINTSSDLNDDKIIKEKISGISIYDKEKNEVSYKKISIDLSKIYILLYQEGITLRGIDFDISIASYILNPTENKLNIENLIERYLEIDLAEFENKNEANKQINLFEDINLNEKDIKEQEKYMLYCYSISKIKDITEKELKNINCLDLFNNIDMPTVEVLSDMQINGMYVDKEELNKFGMELTSKLESITKIIYEMAGEEFNINSTKQLGEILFNKMKLPVIKKTKNGYSTDVDVLEKLKKENPIIEQILEYRQLMKLNSTYVEGLKPYINPKTNRIHSFFHQTITATRKN